MNTCARVTIVRAPPTNLQLLVLVGRVGRIDAQHLHDTASAQKAHILHKVWRN